MWRLFSDDVQSPPGTRIWMSAIGSSTPAARFQVGDPVARVVNWRDLLARMDDSLPSRGRYGQRGPTKGGRWYST
jgi:hypothetical protein